jgi:ubiquinone/menaquinone biosynthesis C-methylase UbiE
MTATVMSRGKFEGLRTRLVRSARGVVLEVGAGEGANFGSLRADVEWIGIEPDPERRAVLAEKARRAGHPREPLDARVEHLPLEDASVDVVLGTYVLCSVQDTAAAAAEFRRVLRPGGRLLFVEHVAAPRGTWRYAIQRAATPFTVRFDHGCRWTNDPVPVLEAAGFESAKLERHELSNGPLLPKSPEILYEGVLTTSTGPPGT